MRTLRLLLGRELRSYLYSPVTWVIVTLAWLLYGLVWWQSVIPASGGDVMRMTWGGALQAVLLQMLFVPLLTMRLLAEEKRSGTFEMLVTAPVRDHEIVLAKFLAAFLVNAGLWSVVWVYFLVLHLSGGEPDPGPMTSAWLSVLGAGAVFTALGLFASALTEHQVMAGFLAIVLIVGFLFLPWAGGMLPEEWEAVREALAAVSLLKQTEEGARGLLDLVHVTYQAAFTGLFILFAVRAVELRKWT